ncbi:MAG: DUF4349 domain-containing protein [Lachnospiraceae bacterium]|nr:DUF4349 domain-containing protein [Lachnospiraceae bacterium]
MRKRAGKIIITAVIIIGVLAGCGSSSSSDSGMFSQSKQSAVAEAREESTADYAYNDDLYEAAVDTEEAYDTTAGNSADPESAEGVSDSEIMANSNRKLIKTVNMSAETREFDKFIANITDKIETLGGYAQSTDISGNSYDSYNERSAFIVARIPATKLEFFVSEVAEHSNITSKNESAEDVTLQYADTEAHRDSLKIEQERLNELLEQADTLENIIELENRLTQVRYEIESYESRLRTMNNQVVYSTVNLNVREVREYTPEPVIEKTFGQRLAEGFLDSCAEAWETIQDFIIGFVSLLPMLLVLLIILAVIFVIIFGIVKLIIKIAKASGKKRAPKKSAAGTGTQKVATAVDRPVVKTDGSDDKGSEK